VKVPAASQSDRPVYGGQAVIEGVMMRGRACYAVAVRAPDRTIQVHTEPLGTLYRSRFTRIPFLRGLFVLWDALVLGIRALTYSANVQAEAEGERLEGAPLVLTMGGSLLLGVAIFFLLPAGAAHLAGSLLLWPAWATNLFEGGLRLVLLLAYVGLIGLMPEIRRVYGYHGAEHKTINAFEAGAPLEPAQVAGHSREHLRCGTAFLLTLVILSVLLFSALGPMPLGLRMITRLLLIPVLASLAYEYIRLSARLHNIRWLRPLFAPNLWLQSLTTREPDEGMLEVAIAAFEAMRSGEAQPGELQTTPAPTS